MRYREAIEYLLTNHVQWDAEDPNIDFMTETLHEYREYKTLPLDCQSYKCKTFIQNYKDYQNDK